MWRASHGSAFDPARAELWSARTFLLRHDRPGSGRRQQLSGAGANLAASVAVDPASDRAVAAWLTGAAHDTIEYASAGGAPGYRPRPATAPQMRPSGGTHWLRIAAAALAAVALLAAAVLALRRRRVLS